MKNSEERRVFYVGLTRTKNVTYLLTEIGNHSPYIDELSNYKNVETNFKPQKELHKLIIKECPICKIKLKVNDFYVSCPNYRFCSITIKKEDINDSNKICNSCNWIMILKKGKWSYYLDCINRNCYNRVSLKNKL